MINPIRNFIPNKFPFYILGGFNLSNIDWNIPSTTYNDCHISFIKKNSDNHVTQLIDSPTFKDGNILDLLLCNYIGLDRVKFHSVDSPLTDANIHSVISFGISVDMDTKPTSRSLYSDFYKAKFDKINKFLSEKIGKLNITIQKKQQFYDEFINTRNF